jgi:ferredoxin
MQLKKYVTIDQSKCNGCGKCITPCSKGGIKIEEGKAVLAAESFCGSFINCIKKCPREAITIQRKELSQAELDNEIPPNAGCFFSGRYDVNHWFE